MSSEYRNTRLSDTARIGPRSHTQTMLLFALFVAEGFVFYHQVAQNIAPFYPPNFDQLSYYLATYDLINEFNAKGFRVFLNELFQPSSATGTTFVLQGALLSLVGGANRTALLSVNFLYLLALQFTFFQTIRARTRDSGSAWLGMALLLALATLFLRLGGLSEIRRRGACSRRLVPRRIVGRGLKAATSAQAHSGF